MSATQTEGEASPFRKPPPQAPQSLPTAPRKQRAAETIQCWRCFAKARVDSSSSRFACRSCGVQWTFRRCPTCREHLLVAASENQFVCVGCGSKHRITTFLLADNTATASTASAFGKAVLSRGANCEREDILIPGFTVVGGYGWAPPAGTRITLAVCADCLKIATVPLTPIVEMSYERLVGFDFQGGATSTGGGFIGGGFGFEGAVKGMLVASVLNSLTERTQINTVVRLSAVDGELYIHHGGVLPDALRTLLGRAVNAVAARDRSTRNPASAADSVTRLEKLAKLHEGGALSDDEFRAAKQKILGEFV